MEIRGQSGQGRPGYKSQGPLELVKPLTCDILTPAGWGRELDADRIGQLNMSAAAVIALRRRRLIRRFREAGATAPERAVTLEAVGERQNWIFDRMAQAGVFRPAPDGRYFMVEAAATEYRRRCRVRALVMTAILASAGLLLWWVVWLCGLAGR